MYRIILGIVLIVLVGCSNREPERQPKGNFSKHVNGILLDTIEHVEKEQNPDYILIEIHKDGLTGVRAKFHDKKQEPDPVVEPEENDPPPAPKTKKGKNKKAKT